MVGEPDAVFGKEELVLVGVHLSCLNGEDDGLPVPLADFHGRFHRCRQMHMLPTALVQPLCFDAADVANGRSVIQNGWRWHWLKGEIDLNGVPLIGANALAVLTKGKPLFVVVGDELVELGAGERTAVFRHRL